MSRRKTSILRVLKPIVAGLALAYLVTAYMDKPAPVHFQPENPYAAKQEEIVPPQDELVTERNIMKLGSPLSVSPDTQVEVPTDNPLAVLENSSDADEEVTEQKQADEPVVQPEVRKEVDVEPVEVPVQPEEATAKDASPEKVDKPAKEESVAKDQGPKKESSP